MLVTKYRIINYPPYPPYPAKHYKEKLRLGNDGLYWVSRPTKMGVYRWIRINKVVQHNLQFSPISRNVRK